MEMIARRTKAPIIPVYMDGLWGSIFSFSRNRFFTKLPKTLNYNFTVAFGAPLNPATFTSRNVLRAFRERDPNRNARQDEVGLAFIGSFDLKFLAHAYGLTANDFNLFARDGKAYFMPLEENFRPFVEWLRDLYAEKLIAADGFNTSDQMRKVEKADAVNVYGSVLTTMVSNFLPTEWLTKYVAMPPLSYNGTQVYRSFAGNVFKGTFAVTSQCENVEEMLRWVDLFYTEEISILAGSGLANVDYLVDGDGTWRITDAAADNMYFTGDTLICCGEGRTDLPGGSSRELRMSLQKLGRLDGDWAVYPGHGDFTSLEAERINNYWMNR
jgi:hypothetical protein